MAARRRTGGRDRPTRHRAGAALLAVALSVTCNLVAGVDELTPKEPAPIDQCDSVDDCSASACEEPSCTDGHCAVSYLPAGTVCDKGLCDALGGCHCPVEGCVNGLSCDHDRDCASHYCKAGTCQDSPCATPCEGVCWECVAPTCAPVAAGDKLGGLCEAGCDGHGTCPSCDNGVLDGLETATDCGGPACPPCDTGQACIFAADCASCVCEGVDPDARCAAPSCGNGTQDGCESDIDCGGACGSTCAAGEKCHAKQDCASHWCENGTCKEVVP